MKKHLFKYLLVILILLGAVIEGQAQTRVYVKVKPNGAVTVKPKAPRADYVWIDDEWNVKNGKYVQLKGHWVEPRKGYTWVPGRWSSDSKGLFWTPGHWKKGKK